jgi:hypothetical protein
MKKNIIILSLISIMTTMTFASSDLNVKVEAMEEEITSLKAQLSANDKLIKKVKKLEKKVNKNKKTITAVKMHDAFDNVKFGLDFRSGIDFVSAVDKKGNYFYDIDPKTKKQVVVDGKKVFLPSGTKRSNDILSSRLELSMMSSPTSKISFRGKFGINSLWGSNVNYTDPSFKIWQGSSRPTNNEFKLKEGYVLYSADNDISYSIGRRPSSEGFLANHRNNSSKPNSPLAHITDMEVDAIMVRLGESYTKATGSYVKIVYGRAHDAASSYANSMYLGDSTLSKGDEEVIDQEVDFFGFLGNIYNDGTYKLMGQHMVILNSKGAKDLDGDGAYDSTKDIEKAGSGKAWVSALSLEVSGLDMIDEDSDVLADTIVFASIAQSHYKPNDGYTMLGTTEETKGHSIWLGATFPDLITEDGKFGIEYNHGSKNWTPFTWAEDTISGSKIATRGDATEVYWNTKIGGFDYLTAQVRYTHVQHDYTPNQKCQGWIKPVAVDLEVENLHLSVRYRY